MCFIVLHKCNDSIFFFLQYQLCFILLHKSNNSIFNPIPTKGGHFGPGRPKAVSHFHSFMTRVTKIHDFVHFSTPLVPVKLFLKKEIWNFKKLKKENLLLWNQRVPHLEKNLKKFKKLFFFSKILIISTWIWILPVFSFLLSYITQV